VFSFIQFFNFSRSRTQNNDGSARQSASVASTVVLSFVILLLFPFSAYSDQQKIQEHKLLVLGDSLSAAYGLTQQQGWVYLLQNAWQKEEKAIEVVNGAISGDTTDGGLSRLPRLLDLHKPTHLLIELGGNDALQGHNPKKIRANINEMVQLAKAQNVEVMIQAMQIPTNYGRRYTQMFTQIYADVAETNGIPLIPFFLEEIALKPELMQNDGIHPTAEAQPMIKDFLKPKLEQHILP
jgi:acyl-CoA thioesterase-1